jgi:hypothetical protein
MNAGKLLSLSAAALMLMTLIASAVDWRVIQHNGREYVTFQNVAEFYQFGEYSHANRTIALRNERAASARKPARASSTFIGVRFSRQLSRSSSGATRTSSPRSISAS